MKNNFERIAHLKALGVWEEDVLPLATRLSTLERYYNIYSFIVEHEPGRPYGAIPKILNNSMFKEQFGSQYDEKHLHKIVEEMTKNHLK